MHNFLTKYEPEWLFILLSAELVFSILIWKMARIEFEYDKEWNERKAARRKKQMAKEKVEINDPIKNTSL